MKIIKFFWGNASSRLKLRLSLMFFFQKKNIKIAVRLIQINIEKNFGCYISASAKIAKSVEFRHPVGIVVGDGVVLSEHVVIYQNVTLGGARIGDQESGKYPRVGASSVVFSGAKIIGDVVIGTDCIIGANAVVNKSVPDGYVAVGIPAKLKERKLK